ncbi:hypothetical protein MKC93_03510 [[Clostridium] innocuum]|nr:hypothetical protein [[Clostridium] innocuum]
MNDTKMRMLHARHLPFYTGLIVKSQFLPAHYSPETKSHFFAPVSAVLALIRSNAIPCEQCRTYSMQ